MFGKAMTKKIAYGFLVVNIALGSLIYSSLQKSGASHISLEGKEGDFFLVENEQYFPLLREKISQAQKEIYLIAFLFKTDPYRYNPARLIMEDLIVAHQRGVKVHVFFERKDRTSRFNEDDLAKANEATTEELVRAGVEVRFDLPQKTTHAKVVIIDRRYVFLGSHNLTKSAFMYNNELSLLVDSPPLASQVLDYLERIESERGRKSRRRS